LARNLFGGTADSVAEDITGARVANAVGSVWDGPSAGAAQLTDLTDINGAPLLQLQADAHGYVAAFYGPDGYERLWVDFGGGRVALVSVTVGERLDSHVSGIDPHGDRAYSDAQITGAKALTSGVHGVTGAVVGTTDTQTLTNKTLNGGTLSGTINGSPTFGNSPIFVGAPQFTGLPKLSGAATATDILGINVTGDGFDRVRVTTDGKISWGPGNAGRDANLYRDGTGFLALSGAALRVYRGATTDPALSTRITGDVNARGVFATDGKLSWGDGSNPQDTTLYRANPGELKTDTVLTVGGELHTNNLVRSNRTNPSDSAFEGRATGDANARWFVREDGLMFWGPGNAVQDTNLYRSGVGALKTDGALAVGGSLNASGGATFTTAAPLSQAATSGTTAFRAAAVGDASDRFQMKGSGLQEWGDGTNPRDTNLYRSAADTLKTDDSFVVGGDLTVSSTTWSTYVPAVANGGTATWTQQVGWYKKLGKLVFVEIYLSANAAGSGTTGITISLPSTPYRDGGSGANTTRQFLGAYCGGVAAGTNSSISGTFSAVVLAGGSGAIIDQFRGPTDIQMRGEQIGTSTIVTIQGWYREA
jgi:hypothetical protein